MKTVMIDHPDHASDFLTLNYQPLEWQRKWLTKTASWYGKKIPTLYTVKYLGRTRRVYSDIYSNTGVTYIIVNGEQVKVY